MVHARVLDKYIHFSLMYTYRHIFPVLPIKNLLNQDGEPTTPCKLETVTKPSVYNIRCIFSSFYVRKATANVDGK